MQNNNAEIPMWAVVEGWIESPTHCKLLPPVVPNWEHDVVARQSVCEGDAFGPMAYDDVTLFLWGEVCKDPTICIVPSNGLQIIYLDEVALEKVHKALDQRRMLPGMLFDPEDSDGLVMVGYGESFANISKQGITASCAPTIAFPIGRRSTTPFQIKHGVRIREDFQWYPPDSRTLDNLAPLAQYLANINLTDKDYADFQKAREEDRAAIIENMEYWRKVEEENKEYFERHRAVHGPLAPILHPDYVKRKERNT